MSNKQYDLMKKLVTIVAPALITLITGLGALYRFDSTAITGTLALLTTFAGTVLGISSKKYNEAQGE
nr:MAG TPA: holin [Caudoviricetes sp.]